MIIGSRDTIAAIATPAGAGGIGVVRVSGPSAVAVLATLLGRSGESFPERTMVHGVAVDSSGGRLDEVLAVVMRAPHSYTGEEVGEIHGHGGIVNMARLLRAVVDAGARHAEAGEFTRRAFENGKLDLVRAEAVLDVIEASSERAWRLAQTQLEGGLGRVVSAIRTRVTQLLAEIEACIDFPEEGESYLSDAAVGARAGELAVEIAALARTYTLGKALREGIEVAIVGPVNSGKSSIFNMLLGFTRAIVDAAPGTTRDFVEASVVWDGVPVTLIDTAGEREAESHVEQQGIAFGRRRAAEADLVLSVHSAGGPTPRTPRQGSRRELHIITKGDLLCGNESELLVTSAHTGQGIAALKQRILGIACGGTVESDDGHVVTSERQRALLEEAATRLRHGHELAVSSAPTEVLAVEVREAAQRLAELLGESVGDDVLDELFQRFCIGK